MSDDLNRYYSPDYFSARQRFRAAAARAGCEVKSYPIDAIGPDQQALTIDVARIGHESAPDQVIISSGLHGIEGFFGSAVQLAWLDRLQAGTGLLGGTAVLLIHSVNPYGFAWLRRFDENNVDPNRNCLLPDENYAGSPPGYAELNGLLNPDSPPRRFEPFLIKALWHIARRGMPALKQAVAGGQYEFPKGLFYGGDRPGQWLEILRANLPTWIGEARRILHLDLHTGLGKSGSFKLLAEYGLSESEHRWLTQHFDAAWIEDASSEGVAYQVRGGLGTWCKWLLGERPYTYLCAEFGTYGPLKVIAGLRDENRAVHWGTPADRRTRKAKQRLKELFCPAAGNWRRPALEQGERLIHLAVEAAQD